MGNFYWDELGNVNLLSLSEDNVNFRYLLIRMEQFLRNLSYFLATTASPRGSLHGVYDGLFRVVEGYYSGAEHDGSRHRIHGPDREMNLPGSKPAMAKDFHDGCHRVKKK